MRWVKEKGKVRKEPQVDGSSFQKGWGREKLNCFDDGAVNRLNWSNDRVLLSPSGGGGVPRRKRWERKKPRVSDWFERGGGPQEKI